MSLTRNALLFSALALPLPALAGGVLVLEVNEHYDGVPVVSTIEISTRGQATRMEVETPSRQEAGGMIYRGDSGEMIALDHGSKSYYVLDEASMRRMGEQLGSAMQQMQEALESMSPEQRAMAEKMMKQHLPQLQQATPQQEQVPATVHAMDTTDTISGFECDYYEVRRGERKIRELCVTPWAGIPGGRDIADAMLDMADFFERMTSALSQETGFPVPVDQQEIFAHLKELDGYPVLTREFDRAGKVATESVLKSATAAELDASIFEPPAGYREMRTPGPGR